MRKKQKAAKKPTRMQALEERMEKVEKGSGIGRHIKTAITAGAVVSAIYAGKGPREVAAIVFEGIKMPWPR